MSLSEDEDALEAERDILSLRQISGALYRRMSSPKVLQSSQPFASSSPAPFGNPFLLEDDEDDLKHSEARNTLDEGDRDSVHMTEDLVAPLHIASTYNYAGSVQARTSSGRTIRIGKRKRISATTTFVPDIDEEHASRTKHYGIAIHAIMSEVDSLATIVEAENSDSGTHGNNQTPQGGMWVDKYRPRKFTELLGDDRTNREVMHWIRHWDYCVFGRAVKHVKSTKNVPTDGPEQSPLDIAVDPHNRPERKILMLTGPPGFGKTTLAHVAARQAGYNVIEVNASDDRTGSVVQNKIGDALESQAVFNPRPSLVVIDEIDGVSGTGGEAGFIRSLLKFVTEDEKASALNRTAKIGDSRLTGKGRKKTTRRALLRPIICICNDQYVAALRPLRQYCQIINFRPLSIPAVVTRLGKICRKEGMTADARALNALCAIAESDLRSCVNSLQYVRMKSTEFTLESVSTTLAQKDVSRSSHSVVEAVFRLLDAKKERKKGNTASSTSKDSIERIADLAMTNNEYSKILNSCFAHYPKAPYHDNLFSKPISASDWLFFYDRCERGVYEHQHGELTNYMPYSVSAFHHLFATHESKNNLDRSKADWEAREKGRVNLEILTGWMNGIKASLRQIFTPTTLATELLSYGLRIVGPNLNPANSHLVKSSDRAALARVVDGMLSMGLHYVQYRVEDGSYVFRLEPPLVQVLNYVGLLELKGESLLPARYAARQIITSELAAEKIRRSLEAQGLEAAPLARTAIQASAETQAQKRKALEELSLQPAQKKDFFGRPISLSREETTTSNGPSRMIEKPKARVHIRFSDGFSDAVRNNISIRELMTRRIGA